MTAMDDRRIVNLLGALSLALADAQTAAAQGAAGLSPSACAALVTLGAHPGDSIGALGAVLGLSHSVTVRLAEHLMAAGLVRRAAGADKRQVMLSLTAKGARARRAVRRAREDALAGALADLEPAARQRLGAALAGILSRRTAGRIAADHICRLCDEDACPGQDCPVEQAAIRIEGAGR
jgi:DNA-binding MarR family transcriptional regulator